ncbi:hypothetical protein [Catenulispora sp. EB89]|uniref:hypothetical protein n=1 Tax=Catenulispora sp. EB89 TaxID=3156257 RepID=UPI0035162805
MHDRHPEQTLLDPAKERCVVSWFRVESDGFEASFLLGVGEDPADACNVDVEVCLGDGSRWGATIFTLDEVRRLMDRWATTGEAQGGRYFACPDGLIVREPGVDAMVAVIAGLLACDELGSVLQRLDESA